MNVITQGIAILALTLPMAAVQGLGQTNAGTAPAEQFAALRKAYNAISGEQRAAKTDRERKLAIEHLAQWPEKFLELADKHPGDPIALKALTQAIQVVNSTDSGAQNAWEMNRTGKDFPAGSSDDAAARAIGLLLRDHAGSEALGRVCERVRYGYRMKYEGFLRTVMRDSPHRKVRALACLSLAQFLNDRVRMLHLAADRAELSRRFEVVFGKNYLPELQKRGTAELTRQAESLFERAARYDDVNTAFSGTVAEQATRELYDIRHLAVGRTAPDIEGRDQDDRPFKLSDYRGKVVLLYFWSEY